MRVPQLTKKAAVLAVLAAALGQPGAARWRGGPDDPRRMGILDRLEGANGAMPDDFSTFVALRRPDPGQEDRRRAGSPGPDHLHRSGPGHAAGRAEEPGTAVVPTTPSPLNAITVTHYRVVYRRTDGRNTQGVDVPYAFDGGMTMTIPEDQAAIGFFELVRIIAKDEAPLRRLVNNGGVEFLNAIAEVTFYGRDQAGNEVSASGSISITFADYGDPD